MELYPAIFIGLRDPFHGLAADHVRVDHLPLFLEPLQSHDPEDLTVVPLKPGVVDVRLRVYLDKLLAPALYVDHCDPDPGVGAACFRVEYLLHVRIQLQLIDHREPANLRLVFFHVGDILTVGRPPVAVKSAELFLIDPAIVAV